MAHAIGVLLQAAPSSRVSGPRSTPCLALPCSWLAQERHSRLKPDASHALARWRPPGNRPAASLGQAGKEDAARAALQAVHRERRQADARERAGRAEQRAAAQRAAGRGAARRDPGGARARQRVQRQRAVEDLRRQKRAQRHLRAPQPQSTFNNRSRLTQGHPLWMTDAQGT